MSDQMKENEMIEFRKDGTRNLESSSKFSRTKYQKDNPSPRLKKINKKLKLQLPDQAIDQEFSN